jgi:hypothetical protein
MMMTKKMYCVAIALVACVAVATAASAKGLKSSKAPSPRKSETLAGKDRVMLEVAGPTDSAAAAAFQKALAANGLQAKLQENKKGGKPLKVVAAVDSNTDLSPWGKAISSALPTKKGQSPPALELVMYAPLTKENASQVTTELEKIKGVDAKHSTVDTKKGALHVRISGTDKVTAADVTKALQSAGITAQAGRDAKGAKGAKTKKT